jgi:hypothetical protein
MPIHRAPWDRRLTTFYCKGWFAHEIQVGKTVLQWAHKPVDRNIHPRAPFGRLLVWRATV